MRGQQPQPRGGIVEWVVGLIALAIALQIAIAIIISVLPYLMIGAGIALIVVAGTFVARRYQRW